MMIAAGEKRSSRGRAKRSGVEIVIANATLSHAIKRWGRYGTAECARRAKTGIVRQDQQNVRCALGCCSRFGKVRLGLAGLAANDTSESRLGDREHYRTAQRRRRVLCKCWTR